MREILSKNDEITDLSREMKQEFNLSESSSLFGTCVDGLITWMQQREDDLPESSLNFEKTWSGRRQELRNWLAPALRSLVQLRNDVG